ncbi:class I adenylate-forming enzyme family protein [Haematobacter missouriensis]|nr:class I adenylate-forming enzyme family protein [Haematobacter missouriensis]
MTAAEMRLWPIPVEEEVLDIPHRIRAEAAKRPEHIALIDGPQEITAAALVDRMDRVAAALAALGLTEGDVIATVGGLTADHLTLYLGAAALGVCVAPLPTSGHPEALARMRENAGAAQVFADAAAPETPGARELEGFVAEARALAPLPPRRIQPDTLFDIIYSSGTTGAPKGIEHDVRFRDNQVDRFRRFGLSEESTVLFSTPLYSNTTLATLIPVLAMGGRVILMRKFDARGFLALAEAHRVTHSMMVPVQIRRVIEHPEFDRFDLSSYQAKLSTSAPLNPAVVEQVLARWPGRMINIYGMTEGGVSAVLDCSAWPEKLHTVGRPGAGAEILILDEAGRPLPQGETGEVVGRSTTMMRGYRNAPEATRDLTWNSPEGVPYIRSGDMGRLDEDGFLTLLDRRKDMIISGGFNIFAADIEAVLSTHTDVTDCAVIGVPSREWGETPVACVVLAPGGEPEAVREWTNARVGRFQRLAGVAVLPELPRSVIGKVLKRELRDRWPELSARPDPSRADPSRKEGADV